MTKSTDDSSFASIVDYHYPNDYVTVDVGDFDHSRIRDIHHNVGHDVPTITPMICVNSGYTEVCDVEGSIVTFVNQEIQDAELLLCLKPPENKSSPNKISPRDMITQISTLQLKENFPKKRKVHVLEEDNKVSSSEHQLKTLKVKSSDVDLVKLCELITTINVAALDLDGKDILLFLGATGAGKTSTMLYLAGTSFMQSDEGMYEIEALPSCHPELEHYKISGGSRSCTRVMQLTTLNVEECNVVLCDTPGFGDTEGIEFDLANGIVMVQSLHRAKSVKPVVVFNKGWQYDRFVSLTQTLQAILRLTGQKETLDFSLFRFVFTGCTGRDAKPISKRLRDLLQEIEASDHPQHSNLMISMVKAMIDDICIQFLYVDLEEDCASKLRQSLIVNENKSTVMNPSSFFVPFVSENAALALNHQLIGSMMQIETLISNESYQKALPIMLQVKHVCCALHSIEFALDDDVCMSRILQKLGKCCIFLLPFDKKDSVLAHFEKLKEINECISQLDINPMELSIFADQLELHLSFLLKANQFGNIILNPIEEAWKIVHLEELSSVLCCFCFNNNLSRLCNKVIDQVDVHVCQEVGAIADCVHASLVNFSNVDQKFIDINMFAAKVVEFSYPRYSKFSFHKKIDSLQSEIKIVLENLVTDLNEFSAKIESLSCKESNIAFSSHEIFRVGEFRAQLIHAIGSKTWYHILFNDEDYRRQTAIKNFDDNVCSWLRHSIGVLEREVNLYDISANPDLDYATVEVTKLTMQEKLYDVRKVCSILRSWEQFNVQVDDMIEKAIQLQEVFKSHIRDIAEENTQMIENCRKANIFASQFLSRVKGEIESYSDLLAELDEPNCWDHWSSFTTVSTFNSVISGFKRMFGLKSESDKLKRNLDEISDTFRQIITSCLDSFLSLESEDNTPLEVAFYLLHKKHKDLLIVLKLVNLRQNSSLRKELIAGHTVQSQYQCLRILSESIKQFGQLPAQLIKDHQFDEAGKLLSLWKDANEIWRVLHSFANVPISQLTDCSRAACEFQKGIRESESYESIVTVFFKELKVVQLQIDAIDLDCSEESVIEKMEYYQRQEQVLCQAKRLEQCGDHALSPEQQSLLSLENDLLMKYAVEVDLIEQQLIKELDNFPAESRCYKAIHNLMANLNCIEMVFKQAKASISRRANAIKLVADEEVELKFNTMMKSIDINSPECVCSFVLTWKQVGYDIICWRNVLHKNIDMMLHSTMKNSSNPALLLFCLSSALRAIEGDRAVVAGLMLSEHTIFEGTINTIFYENTRMQGIGYVLAGLTSVSKLDRDMLEDLHRHFETIYIRTLGESFVEMLRVKGNKKSSSVNNHNTELDPAASTFYFQTKVSSVIKNFNSNYAIQVAELTAILCARWSVANSKFFFRSQMLAENQSYLKKPHPAQVIGIWLMLNVLHCDYQSLEHVLVELQTGEGKSICIGIAATMLALFGYQVDCACYSAFLSGRDYDDFRKLFDCFGVTNRIRYSTIDKFTNKLTDVHHATLKSRFCGNQPLIHSQSSNHSQPRILLVDEVDVFFGKEIFGKTRRSSLTLSNNKINDLFYTAWNNCEDGTSLAFETAAQELVSSYPIEFRNVMRQRVSSMLDWARKLKIENLSEYAVVNNTIAKKRFDSVAEYVGNEINFLYIKHAESGEIPKSVADKRICLSPCIGKLSYAELPFEYEAIIGITGTLRGLGESSREVLTSKYNIKKHFHVPSVYGNNRLSFLGDNSKDVIVSDSEADFFLELKHEILARQRPLRKESNVTRPVMLFFRSKVVMMNFYNSNLMESLKQKIQVIDETMSKAQRDGLFLHATEQGSITLMIRDFGRGTDFKCFDTQLQREGGVHVIQAFFSTEVSEEIQIKGRTARQGTEGSFSMVLNVEDLLQDFGISLNDISGFKLKGTMYSSLDEIRKMNDEEIIKSSSKVVKDAEKFHYRTLAFMDESKSEHVDQAESISFLEELNHVNKNSAFKKNNKKEEKHTKSENRLKEMSLADQARRLCKSTVKNDDTEMARVRRMVELNQCSHYDVLGIYKESSTIDIIKAYQTLVKLFHPDKCDSIDAVTITQRLNAIKDELCSDDELRKQYDNTINATANI